jgi:aminopeptidase N
MLNHDGFYGVRVEASRALRNIHTDEALKALLASRDQADARVRRQVLEDISGFYDGQASDAALKAVANEKNPAIVSVAIHSLGAYPQPEVRPMLLKYLDSTSFRNELAGASVRALRSQDDPANIVPLLETLSRREADFTSHEFADGLETLAYLARNEQNKDSVRDFLLARVNHNKRSVRVAALNALGTLGDPKALPAVQKFSTASKASPERGAAERAAMSLRAARKPVDDFKNLRQEVLDLQSANRELRKEIDDLKKKVEAAVKPKAEDRPPKTRIKSPKA